MYPQTSRKMSEASKRPLCSLCHTDPIEYKCSECGDLCFCPACCVNLHDNQFYGDHRIFIVPYYVEPPVPADAQLAAALRDRDGFAGQPSAVAEKPLEQVSVIVVKHLLSNQLREKEHEEHLQAHQALMERMLNDGMGTRGAGESAAAAAPVAAQRSDMTDFDQVLAMKRAEMRDRQAGKPALRVDESTAFNTDAPDTPTESPMEFIAKLKHEKTFLQCRGVQFQSCLSYLESIVGELNHTKKLSRQARDSAERAVRNTFNNVRCVIDEKERECLDILAGIQETHTVSLLDIDALLTRLRTELEGLIARLQTATRKEATEMDAIHILRDEYAVLSHDTQIMLTDVEAQLRIARARIEEAHHANLGLQINGLNEGIMKIKEIHAIPRGNGSQGGGTFLSATAGSPSRRARGANRLPPAEIVVQNKVRPRSAMRSVQATLQGKGLLSSDNYRSSSPSISRGAASPYMTLGAATNSQRSQGTPQKRRGTGANSVMFSAISRKSTVGAKAMRV